METCKICRGERWVCEDHPDKAWNAGDGCCGGAGMPCVCNKSNPPWMPPGMEPGRATPPPLMYYELCSINTHLVILAIGILIGMGIWWAAGRVWGKV